MKLNWQTRDLARVDYFIRRGMFQDLDREKLFNEEPKEVKPPNEYHQKQIDQLRSVFVRFQNKFNSHIDKKEYLYE